MRRRRRRRLGVCAPFTFGLAIIYIYIKISKAAFMSKAHDYPLMALFLWECLATIAHYGLLGPQRRRDVNATFSPVNKFSEREGSCLLARLIILALT